MSAPAFLTADSPVVIAALDTYRRGWTPVVLGADAERRKAPIEADWQRLVFPDEETLLTYLTDTGLLEGVGIGGRLGDWLADVDLDDPVALLAAKRLLPPTPARSGRPSSPESHWWYRLDEASDGSTAYLKHTDGDGKALVELRADRLHQTALPPTVHPSGEVYEWAGEPWGGPDGPAVVDAARLRNAVNDVALVAALARGWPGEGSRHDAYLALAGALLRAWPRERVEAVISTLAHVTGDRDGAAARVKESVPTTLRRLERGEGQRVTGWTRLASLVSDQSGITLGRTVARGDDGALTEGLAESPAEGDDDALLFEDLSQWADPNFRPPKVLPTMLKRTDGLGLFYENQLNYLYGPSEQGKSWVAVGAAVEVLNGGGTVNWFDLDEMNDQLPNRFRMLGVHPEVFANGQLQVARVRDAKHLTQLLAEPPADLSVLDGMTGYIAMLNPNSPDPSNSPDTVNLAMRGLSKMLRGATGLLIDHTNKRADLTQGPSGAGAKMNVIRGSMIGVSASNRTRPLPGGEGFFQLEIYKEMSGALRADARARDAAQSERLVDVGSFYMRCTMPEDPEAPGSLHYEVRPPSAKGKAVEGVVISEAKLAAAAASAVPDLTTVTVTEVPIALREKIIALVRKVPDIHMTAITEQLKERKEDVSNEVNQLVSDKVLSKADCGSECTRCASRHGKKVHLRVVD